MPVLLGRVVFWSILASTPLALLLFAARSRGGGFLRNAWRILVDFRWHLALFMLILVEKNWVDSLNHPIRGVFGDKTWLLAKIEGDAVLHLQRFFEVPALTAFLNVHYIWMYVFMTYFTVLLWAYRDDRELANLSALSYSVIYVLAIPFYTFFNVQVTSDYLPGMKGLLYHSSASFYDFFVRVDPLDNAFPSLHIAIPFGMMMTMVWTMRRRGYTWANWEHRRYLLFFAANLAIFAFSILYLGVHWIVDIPGGLVVGLLGAIIADELHGPFFASLRQAERRVGQLARRVVRRPS